MTRRRNRKRASDEATADVPDVPDVDEDSVTSDDAPTPWSRALRAVSAVGPPITIGAALLLYFGWARTDAQARELGLDVSLFGYTPQDYILRSISSLFIPLTVIVVIAIVWNAVDRWLHRALDAGRGRNAIRRVALLGVLVGLGGALTFFTAALLEPEVVVLFRPYIIALGVLIAAWGVRLVRAAGPRPALRAEQRAVETTLVLCLVTMLLFWGTAEYAQSLGKTLAIGFEKRVADLPRGTLYSRSPLAIGAPGVEEEPIGSDDSPLYRYTGLRLLVMSGGRAFFLHDGWTVDRGVVTVVADNGDVRYEFGN